MELAIKYNITPILDMHSLPGHSFMTPESNSIWTSPDDQDKAIEIWSYLSKTFNDSRIILELLNEPTGGDIHTWNSLWPKLASTIRKYNSVSTILVSTYNMGSPNTITYLTDGTGIEYMNNIMVGVHIYEPFLFTHQNAHWVDDAKKLNGIKVPYPGPFKNDIIRNTISNYHFMYRNPYNKKYIRGFMNKAVKFRDDYNIPILNGEIGVLHNADKPDRLRWLNDVSELHAELGIGLCLWNYKSDNFGIVSTHNHIDKEAISILISKITRTFFNKSIYRSTVFLLIPILPAISFNDTSLPI